MTDAATPKVSPMALKLEGFLYLTLFALSVPAANWIIGNWGTTCVKDGPCLIPVAPGLMAPSSVMVIGLAFVLRDLVQRRLGALWALAAIAIGGALSGLLAPKALVLASVTAFLVSELADFAIYTPLQKKGLILAVFASSMVGLVIDSLIFLQLAFGSLDFLLGQVVGKSWMVVAALPFIYWLRQWDRRRGLAAA